MPVPAGRPLEGELFNPVGSSLASDGRRSETPNSKLKTPKHPCRAYGRACGFGRHQRLSCASLPFAPLSALSLLAVSKTRRRRSLTADYADYADCADTIDPILAVGGNEAVSRVLESDRATRKSSSPMAQTPPTAQPVRRRTKKPVSRYNMSNIKT